MQGNSIFDMSCFGGSLRPLSKGRLRGIFEWKTYAQRYHTSFFVIPVKTGIQHDQWFSGYRPDVYPAYAGPV